MSAYSEQPTEREYLEGLRYEDKFPPDCPVGERCKSCHKCYIAYVEEKMAGLLDE